jgi:hypothetical protein
MPLIPEREVWHDRARMCANCVASIDAAAAAVGGVAGLRAWLRAHTALLATRRRARTATAVLVVLAVVLAGAITAGP